MMLAAAEAVGPQLVASLLYKRAAAHKNPKVRQPFLGCNCGSAVQGHHGQKRTRCCGFWLT